MINDTTVEAPGGSNAAGVPVERADTLPRIEVSWTSDGCLLEMTGRLTHSLLDHARDLVYAQTRPGTCLTVRLDRPVVTRDLIAMLVAARRYLRRAGSRFVVEAPDVVLPRQLVRALAEDDAHASR
jgi:hypothetical protein